MFKDKICIVTNSFAGGGAERVAVNLANYYADYHDVTVIAFNSSGPMRSEIGDGINVVDLQCKRTRNVGLKLYFALKKLSPNCVLSVVRDANIFTGISCLFLRKLKVTFREANTMQNVTSKPKFSRIVYKSLMKLSYARANKIICNSIDTRDDLVSNSICSIDKMKVVGNPVIYKSSKDKRKGTVDDEWFRKYQVILGVGRLHEQKNFKLLIDSFAIASQKNPFIRLVLLGEGDLKEDLIKHARMRGIDSKFKIIDFVSNPYPYYKKSKLFVLSSSWEGFGNVLVESLYCGTNVVSTLCPGGPREILSDNVGSLVEMDNAVAMADLIISSIGTDTYKDVKSRLRKANEYHLDIIAPKYMAIMKG